MIAEYFEVHVQTPKNPRRGKAQVSFIGVRKYPTNNIMDPDLTADLNQKRAEGLKGFFIRECSNKRDAAKRLAQIPNSLPTLNSFYIL